MSQLPDINSFFDIEIKEMRQNIINALLVFESIDNKMKADGRWELVLEHNRTSGRFIE